MRNSLYIVRAITLDKWKEERLVLVNKIAVSKLGEIIASKLESVQANDIMTRKVFTATPDTTVTSILAKMEAQDIHDIPIVEDGRVVGVVSFDTLLKRREVSLKAKAKSVMIAPPKVQKTANVMELSEMFVSTGFRELMVTSKRGKLLGIVTRADVLRVMSTMREFDKLSVSEIMTPEPVTVSEDDDVEEVKQVLRKLETRSLPVVDSSGRLTGIIGIKDISRFVWRKDEGVTSGEVTGESVRIKAKVKSVMVEYPSSVSPETTVLQAAKLMYNQGISTLPVVVDSKPVGILTQYDLVSYLASFLKRDMVLVQISGIVDEESYLYQPMFDEIHSCMRKIARIEKPTMMDLHVRVYKQSGDKEKYSLQSRLTTEEGMYYAKASDWDPMKALGTVLDHLERRVKERKEEALRERRRVRLE